MSKKVISFIICISIILGSLVPCFAISTDSAIKATKELKALGDTKAATEVSPSSSSGYYYYYNGTSNLGYTNINITTWAGLVTGITQGIANSIKNLANINSNIGTTLDNTLSTIYTRLGNTNSYIDGIEGYLYNINNSLYYGQTGVGTIVNDLKTLLTTNNTSTSNISSDTSNIYSLLSNGLNIDLGSPWQPYFMPSDNYDFNNNDWDYYYLRTVDEWGNVSSTSYTQTNILTGLKRLLVNINNNETYGFRNICRSVGGTANDSFVPKLYNIDLTTTNADKLSLWRTIFQYGENTSMFLSRLGYVLASDDEIAARQAASANQDVAVDEFISSSGSASASTTDLGDMASGSSAIKNALSSNADIDDALGIFNGDTSIWDWFTTETKNSFDNVSVQRSSVDNYTHYVDNFYSEVLHGIHADIK